LIAFSFSKDFPGRHFKKIEIFLAGASGNGLRSPDGGHLGVAHCHIAVRTGT